MQKVNLLLTILMKLMVITLTLVFLYSPSSVGIWNAQMQIAYDSIWGEYIMDCDCTSEIEE